MKKGIAAVLSAVMVFASMYVGLSTVIGVSAATDIDFTYVDFDGKTSDYYSNNDNYRAYLGANFVDSGDGHGKAVEFTQMSNWSNKWPNAIAVSSYDGKGRFEVKKGETYTISFDYRNIKVNEDLQIAAIFVDKSVNANGGGSVEEAEAQGKYTYLCWASRDNKDWTSHTNTFEAPCDGTILLVPITWNPDIKGQKIWLDNIAIEKKVAADGNSIDVEYHYGYDDKVETKEAYLGGGYSYAVRKGYIFEGWYVDEELTVPAPRTVRQSCTKLYAKWSVDDRVAQITSNTYDDSDMQFTAKAEESGTVFYLNKKGETTQNTSTEFSMYGARINTTAFDSRVLSFTQASSYEWQWPTIAAIYDNKNKTARFLPNMGSVYEISLKYRVDKAADKKLFLQVLNVSAGIGNPNGGYNSQNVYVKSLAEITDKTDGWVEANAVFTTNNSSALCLTLVSESTAWGDTVSGLEIYVDDVKVTERLDAYGIYFDTNGGESMSPVKCLGGAKMPVFNVPVREGYCFTGWYYDSKCTKAFSSTVMPQEDLILYAGWASLDGMPQSLKTGFEESQYQKQVYTNDGTTDPVSDASMTDSAVWHKNDPAEAYDGSGYIAFDDGDTVLTDSRSNKFMAISLYNPDGTPFCVTEGKRYKISLAYRHSGSSTNQNTQFMFLITNQSPGIGVNYGNSTVLYETGAMGADKHETQTWGEFSTYAVAGKTGPVKLAMYGTSADQKLDVDNVKIELMSESECVKVEYIQQNEKGEGQYSSGVRYGAPGDLLIAGQSNHIDGYAFNGWRTADGELYSSNRFPSSDLTLYASWRVADNADDAAPNPKEEFLLDFEDTDRAKAFYEDSANNYHPENGVFLTVNDPDNAHSGNNYFQFYQCGHWMEEYLRRFKLYDPDTAGNQVYLEPNSVYKVSFWLNIESIGAGNLYLCTFPDRNSMTEYEVQNENYITDTNSFENFGKWVLYENTVVTGDDEDGDGIAATLGFTFYGGYLTAKLDDISVIKLKEVTVSFESNGGSDVNDITQLSYDYAIAPADPEREGYTFTGWYTDEKLTQPFNFKTELITKDIKLYAGWKVAEKDTSGSQNATNEKEPIYNTVIDYEKAEQTVGVEVPDKELDEQLTFADTDKVGKINKQNASTDVSDGSSNLVWIIIAIAGGVVLVAAAAVVTVMVVKKRKRRN